MFCSIARHLPLYETNDETLQCQVKKQTMGTTGDPCFTMRYFEQGWADTLSRSIRWEWSIFFNMAQTETPGISSKMHDGL